MLDEMIEGHELQECENAPACEPEDAPLELGRAGSLHVQGRKWEALEELDRLLLRRPDCAEAHCIRALIQMELGEYAQSVQSWDRFHELSAPDLTSRLSRAQCHQSLGRWIEAGDELRAILAEEPTCDEAALRLGLNLLHSQQPEEAAALLSKYLERHSAEPAARFGLAVAYQMLCEPDDAVRLYETLVWEGSYRMEALSNLLAIYRQQKDAVKLAEGSRLLLEESPDSIPGLEAGAHAAFLQEDYATASEFCDRAALLEGGRAERWMNLALCRRKLGQTPLALQAYGTAASLQPELTEAHVRITELLLEQGREGEALEACLRGLASCPDAEELYHLLTAIHEKAGRFLEAEAALEALLARRPECANAWFGLGNLRLDRRNYDGALAAYWACLSLRDDWPEARLNLSLAYCEADKPAEGARELDILLAQRPDWEPALRAAAVAALKLGDSVTALEIHRRLIELGHADADVYYNAALLSEQADRGVDSSTWYAKALALRPGFAEALVGLGHALDREGRDAEARQCWAQAMELRPSLAKEYFRLRS